MEIQELFERYELFCKKKTTGGEHGSTVKYWMIYIKLIDLYHQFVRSIRTGDYKLSIYLLPEITNLYFISNHKNYARWLAIYHANLMKMEETHPGISEYFENGIIYVRRTKKPFSRIPIDLTLEQTINKDAESSSSGIINILHMRKKYS